MKRTSRTVSRSWDHVHLYMDDMKLLFEIMKEAAGEVEVTVPGFSLDQIEELQKLGARVVREIEFRTREPYVALEIRSFGVRLFCYEEERTEVLVRQIDSLMQSRRTLGGKVSSTIFWVMGQVLLIAVAAGTLNSLFAVQFPLALGGASVSVAVLFWILLGVKILREREGDTLVYVQRARGKPSFYSRHKDKIILGATTSLIGALIGGAIARFVFGK